MARGRRHFIHQYIAAQVFSNDAVRGQFPADAFGLRLLQIHFVDGDNERRFGRARMANRFHRLRFYAVIGGHHQNHQVGHLRAAHAHRRKRLMPRGI